MSKKVAIVTAVFPPYRGGIGTVAFNQARVLSERGCEVTVFSPDYSYPSSSRPSPQPSPKGRGSFVLKLLNPVLKYGNAAWVPSLKEKLKEFNVVILQYPFFGGMRAVYKAKKKYGFKLIVNYHMDVVGCGLKGLVFWYATKFFLPRIIKAADFVLASSEDYAQHSSLGKYWQSNNSKFQIIPNGVDISHFAFNDSTREPVVLFVGGLDKAHYFKGVEYLIRSAQILEQIGSNGGNEPIGPSGFKLILAGDGDLAEGYKKLARDLGVGDKVEFAGSISDEGLVRLYQRAAVTVLPSIDQSEAFGIVLVESMACATPVITSDLPGVRSVYENGVSGFSVPARDIKALAEKIKYVLDSPDQAQVMGRAGRKLVEERYNWEVIGDKLLKLVEN